jgi:hypothetical protein
MPDNRRFKGRSQGLQALLEGIFEHMGSDVQANPDQAVAQGAIDRGFVAKGDEEKAVRSGQQNQPFKAGNIIAKPNARALNADQAVKDMDREANAKSALDTEAKMTPIMLERWEKQGLISNQQKLQMEKDMIPIEAEKERVVGGEKVKNSVKEAGEKGKNETEETRKRGNYGVVNAKGMLADDTNLYDYNAETRRPALDAARTGFEKESSGNVAAKGLSDLQSTITKETGPLTVDNAKYSASKFQRNAESDYINSILKPLGTGQNIVDIRNGKIAAKGPSEFGMLENPTAPIQQSPMMEEQQITLSDGSVKTILVPRKPKPLPAPEIQQPEQATEVVQQAPPSMGMSPLSGFPQAGKIVSKKAQDAYIRMHPFYNTGR